MSAQDQLGQQFLYHFAPTSVRSSIAEHGLDASRFTEPRRGKPAIFFNHSRALADEMGRPEHEDGGGLYATHDLYEAHRAGLNLHPDPYQPEDASYTHDVIPPAKARLVRKAGRS